VLVVGTGLIGTSIGLALRRHAVAVHLADRDPTVVESAAELGAGDVGGPDDDPDVVVLAVPPREVAGELRRRMPEHDTAVFTDVSSAQRRPQQEARALGCDLARFVGGHPLAGRERSGPLAGRGDLFEGRPWVLTRTSATAGDALGRVRELVAMCGATPVELSPEEHDAAVALVSHAPQVIASAVAARLVDAAEWEVALAGQGLRDLTRIAASDPELWVDILATNAGPVADVLGAAVADLDAAAHALRALESADRYAPVEGTPDGRVAGVLADLLRRGNAGRDRVPGKHGGAAPRYVPVPVVIDDKPGALGRLFSAAGDAGVNIEDVTIEHSPGQPVGLISLFVAPDLAVPLTELLRAGGWRVQT
jgi:prephenate dehydrogenase